MKIIRTPVYLRSLKKLHATEAELAAMVREIAKNPQAGDVIPGLAGLRKIRFAMGGKGKRGGGRAVYFLVLADDTVFLLFAYSKAAQEDLSADQKRLLLQFVEEVIK